VLELLHKNAKLERIYHKTCEKAFKFCQDYQRSLEFRRLCEMLRNHFSNLQKMTSSASRVGAPRIAWEWTNESVEMHLHTRFVQLEVATALELWNEGFQTVEDIYEIIMLGKKMPKPKVMAAYYEKLTKIFWVADSLLFHAYAWLRFYTLSCESRKDLKAEDKATMATCVLLAALGIPSTRDNTDPSSLAEEDEIASDKAQQMAKLLDFQANPTRKALLEEIVAKGLLQDVLPEVAPIYAILETKFNPLGLVAALKPVLAAVRANPQLNMYVLPLERVAVVRVMQQLSRVYSALKMDFLQRLLSGLEDISFNAIEKIMIDGVSRKQLQVRIDHRNGCLRFGSSGAATAETIETQVAQLGKTLNGVAHSLQLSLGTAKVADDAAQARKEYFLKVLDAAAGEHQMSVDRKSLIERRKEELERLQQDRQKEEQRLRDHDEERRRRMDEMRLVEEQRQREEEKKRKLLQRQEVLRAQKELERLGVFMDEAVLMDLTPAARSGLITDAKNEALKAKEEEGRRVNDQAKRLDHITRALRIEAAEVIATKYADQVEIDRQAFQAKLVELVEESKKQHATDLEEKKRLSKIQPLRGPFEEAILAKQRAAYDKRVQQVHNRALKEFRDRKVKTKYNAT
jgi:translation initiation factor 3 subunit A